MLLVLFRYLWIEIWFIILDVYVSQNALSFYVRQSCLEQYQPTFRCSPMTAVCMQWYSNESARRHKKGFVYHIIQQTIADQCLFVSKRSPAPTMTAKSGIICPTLYVPRWEVID